MAVREVLVALFEPFRLTGIAIAQGRIPAALFLLLTSPFFLVLTMIRRQKPRKTRDSAFMHTMR